MGKKKKKKVKYTENCANCKYWNYEENVTECPSEIDSNECHRYPPHIPTPKASGGKCPNGYMFCIRCFECGIAYAQGPQTFADQFCGEFKIRKHPFVEWSEDYEED